MLRSILHFSLLCMAVVLGGCSSTTLSGSWRDPEYQGQLRKVYIVGVAQREITRRIFEDAFDRELGTFGVTGIASYRDLPPDQLENKANIVSRLEKHGADSILMARVTDVRTEQVQTPGYISGGYFSPAPYYRRWDSYYERRYEAIYEPPTISTYQVATVEANLYAAGTGILIWSAQLETVIDRKVEQLLNDFVRTVIKDMQRQGLL